MTKSNAHQQRSSVGTTFQILSAVALACSLSLTARAQIGSGWTSTTETFTIQTSAGCTAVPNSSGGGTFSVPAGINRSEFRFNNLATTTTEQFQGDVTLVNLDGNRVTLKQTFGPGDTTPGTPWSLLAIDKTLTSTSFPGSTGGFYDVEASPQVLLAPFTVGQTARINTIYDPSGGPGKVSVAVYINGTFVEKLTDGTAPNYNKIGSYVSGSGTGPCISTWQNILFWTGGSSSLNMLTAPTSSPAPGTYTSTQTVTISSSTTGATIAYTTDGSTPVESGGTVTHGTLYSGPVSVSATTTINAIAFKSGFIDSSAANLAFTINPSSTPAPAASGGGGGGAFDGWFLGFLAFAGLSRWKLRKTR